MIMQRRCRSNPENDGKKCSGYKGCELIMKVKIALEEELKNEA